MCGSEKGCNVIVPVERAVMLKFYIFMEMPSSFLQEGEMGYCKQEYDPLVTTCVL